jgi:hypothetical protein
MEIQMTVIISSFPAAARTSRTGSPNPCRALRAAGRSTLFRFRATPVAGRESKVLARPHATSRAKRAPHPYAEMPMYARMKRT